MASTFSGLQTAYSGLTAARDALNVTGQNITNAGTEGYSRQRLETQALFGPANAGRIRLPVPQPGGGVGVTGIGRISDELTNTRFRTATGQYGFADMRASALSALEDSLNEPSDTGLAAQLQGFWASWQDLANNPGQSSAGSVVLAGAQSVINQIATGYRAAAGQWSGLRGQLGDAADQLNTAADRLAQVNGQIQQALASGASANELMDQRDQLAAQIAGLAGGSVTVASDGTANVFVAGNILVTGQTANHVQAAGATSLEGAAGDPPRLEWAAHPGAAIDVDGGSIAATVSLLAPAAADGSGGPLAQAAAGYNQMATALAAQVNAVHETAATADGRTGLDFFSVAAGVPAALGLSLTSTDPADIAAGAPGAGALDGSVADQISQLGQAAGSPDALWSSLVSTVGVASQTAQQQSVLAGTALQTAATAQQSISSVDTDQENLDLITEQSSYQSAARVMTTVDQLLDTLINHTGIVGLS